MKRKYRTLRAGAVILTILAWIALIFGVLGSIAWGVLIIWGVSLAGDVAGGQLTTAGIIFAVIVIVVGVIASLFYFLILLGAAQLIYVLMDVEHNTRETAYRLRTGRRQLAEPVEE